MYALSLELKEFANELIVSHQKKKLRSRQKKLKAYDLSALSEFLPELKTPKQTTAAADFKLNCKSRQQLMCVFQFCDSILL